MLGLLAVAGASPAADARPDAPANGQGTETAIPAADLTALITQAGARAASAKARGASALAAVATVTTNEPGTAPSDPADVEIQPHDTAQFIQFRPFLPAAQKATVVAAKAATAALISIEKLPHPPKDVQLTAAVAKRAADKAAATPTDIALANAAATAENNALAASAVAFGTTATKVEWVSAS
ncbi:hypothetical protein ACFYO1_39795 [Nocardia sp. NPDC006044]|uniref:hypothetical protein n=1 Tax=Nocardia sp. NPDC006044 TaxID=3364306 RepID=UPI0036ADFF3F